MVSLIPILLPICLFVALPILIVWLISRVKINETNRHTEIILAAIEKNSEINVEDFIKKLNLNQKTIKERLLNKLKWGTILLLSGIGFCAITLIETFSEGYDLDLIWLSGGIGIILFAIGIAILITYFVGKKMLAKEMEAELNTLQKS